MSTSPPPISNRNQVIEICWNSLLAVVHELYGYKKRRLKNENISVQEYTKTRKKLTHIVTANAWRKLKEGLTYYKGPHQRAVIKITPKFFSAGATLLPSLLYFNACEKSDPDPLFVVDPDKIASLPTLWRNKWESMTGALVEWNRRREQNNNGWSDDIHLFYKYDGHSNVDTKAILDAFYTFWKNNNFPIFSKTEWNNQFNEKRGKERQDSITKAYLLQFNQNLVSRKRERSTSALNNFSSSLDNAQNAIERMQNIKTKHLDDNLQLPLKVPIKRAKRTKQSHTPENSTDLATPSTNSMTTTTTTTTMAMAQSLNHAAYIAAQLLNTLTTHNTDELASAVLKQLGRIRSERPGQEAAMHAAANLLSGSTNNSNNNSNSNRQAIGHDAMTLVKHSLNLKSVDKTKEQNKRKISILEMLNGNTPSAPDVTDTTNIQVLDTIASAASPQDVKQLYEEYQDGQARLLNDERLTNRIQSFVRGNMIQRLYGSSTKSLWDSQLKPTIEELLRLAEIYKVSVPSANVASSLVERPETETFTNTEGVIFVQRANYRKHMQKYLNDFCAAALLKKYGNASVVHIKGIARADATNLTTGSTSRTVTMNTVFFFDIGYYLGVGNDSVSQQSYAVGYCTDGYKLISEFVKDQFIPRLQEIFSAPFTVTHGDQSMLVHIEFGWFFADGHFLRDVSGHLVQKWKFQNPFHSMTSSDTAAGNFASWGSRDRLEAEEDDGHSYGADMIASRFLAQTTSHTNASMDEVLENHNENAATEFGINPNGNLLRSLCNTTQAVNDSWHSVATGGKGTDHKLLFTVFQKAGQLQPFIHHCTSCMKIPMHFVASPMEVRVDGGDRLRLDLTPPNTSPICTTCPTCNLLLKCTPSQREILHLWNRCNHIMSVVFTTKSKLVLELLLPCARKVAACRDELRALIATPEFGGATPHVAANQVITATQDILAEVGATIAEVDQERMENEFKYYKDYFRGSNHAGSGNANASAKAVQTANGLLRCADSRIGDYEASADKNTLARQKKYSQQRNDHDDIFTTCFKRRKLICPDCTSLRLPCCVACLQEGCKECTTSIRPVGSIVDENPGFSPNHLLTKARYHSPLSKSKISKKVFGSEPRTKRDLHRSKQQLLHGAARDRKSMGSSVRKTLGKRTRAHEDSSLRMEFNRSKRRRIDGEEPERLVRVQHSMDDYMTFNPQSYGSELRQRKEKFMVDVNAYNANRKAVGAIAPNHFKKAITATVVEFLRVGAGGNNGFDRQFSEFKKSDGRFSIVLSISPRSRVIYIEFKPRTGSNLRRQRFNIPFNFLDLKARPYPIGRDGTFEKWIFSFNLILPPFAEVYNSNGEWKRTSNALVGDDLLRKCPQIIFETILKTSDGFKEWFSGVQAAFPAFQTRTAIIPYDYLAVQSKYDAAMNDTLISGGDGLITEATATRCHLSLFDPKLAVAVEEQALNVVIPRFWNSNQCIDIISNCVLVNKLYLQIIVAEL